MLSDEVFLLSLMPRVTFTPVVMTDRQRLCDATSSGFVRFMLGARSRTAPPGNEKETKRFTGRPARDLLHQHGAGRATARRKAQRHDQ